MKNDSFSISPVGEIYELTLCIKNPDGSYDMESVRLDLENTTLEEAIENTIQHYYLADDADLYKTYVFEDKNGNKYFSEIEHVRNVTI
jgi:hypothetical protein